MVMDILGVLIAFVTVMLLFSLFVTAVIQALDFRGFRKHRNLILGMTRLGEALNDSSSNALDVTEFTQLTTRSLLLKKATYVSLEQVKSAYQRLTKLEPGEQIEALFSQIEDEMRVEFKRRTDSISIVVAFVLVIVMQLNAFTLFAQLNQDAQLRSALNAHAQAITKTTELPQQMLDQQRQNLQHFGFKVFPNKNFADVYLDLNQWLGMLLSTILISFGAPFWFNMLKNVVGLKDALALKNEPKPSNSR